MADVNAADMLEELSDNVKTGDAMKAQLVLAHLGDVDEAAQRRLLYILSRADEDFAITQLLHLINADANPAGNIPRIKETLMSVFVTSPAKLPEWLGRDLPAAEKVPLIRIAGELRMDEAVVPLHDIAASTKDEAVIIAIIESLGFIASPESENTLGEYLYAADRDLIAAAVDAMGRIGTSTAMQRLAERMGTDSELDYAILDIFARVQDSISLERLNETIMSHYARMRTFAKTEMVKIGAKAVPFLIENLDHDDADFVIHTLNVLADIGDESAVAPIRRLINTVPANANVRFAAYEALAELPLRKGAYTLTAGLTDSEEHVCIAAARAIDRNFTELLGAGLKNLLRGDDDEARHISRIIINSQSDNIFTFLIDDEAFVKYGSEYMPAAHPDICSHFAGVLKRLGREESTLCVGGGSVAVRRKIVAVDDSRMILGIYKVTLHELGYEPVLFEFPVSALEWLRTERPVAVFTDLNMPKMTGVELTGSIRELYSAEQLPVIMVTTQSDGEDTAAAVNAGVTAVLKKPFTAETLGAALVEALPEKGD